MMTNSIQTNIQNIQNNLNQRRGLDSTGNITTANMTQPNHQFVVSGNSASKPESQRELDGGTRSMSDMNNTNCNVTASLNDIDLKSLRNTLANYELNSQSKKFTH
jgi:hypothetical protein